MIKITNYIGGKFCDAIDGSELDVFNPANGQVYAKVVNSKAEDVERAYEKAESSFAAWASASIEHRSKIMMRIADLIEDNLDKLAEAESLDNGKPIWLAKKVDIPRAAANFHFFAHAITQFHSQAFDMGKEGINYTLNQPLGVVACISPWNLPLYLFTWKIAPAIAAGNTVIAKPSEVTPYTAFLLSKLCDEAGLPAGVLNILHGEGQYAGDAISSHPGIKAISFTGSTKIGGRIASIAGPLFKKLSLEMGGKNANIIFDDCDYDKMLKTTINSSFSNQGQICLCGSRILIHEAIYDRFKKDFVEQTKNLIIGPPTQNVKIGALVSKAHYEKILNCIEIAKSEGGKILTGGQAVFPQGHENGWYVEPTIIEGLNQNCLTNQEEIFGPVVTIQKFSNVEEALTLANATQYGLSATVWTQNLTTAHQVANKLHAGIIWVNTWLKRDLRTPFGGVKNSGVGREGGFDALKFFTEPKNICIEY